MMKSLEVLAAKYDEATSRIIVIKEITNDDDTVELNGHSLPPELFEWLAATYDIDDIDELIDIALYEPFVRHEPALSLPLTTAQESCRSKTAEAKSLYGKRRHSRASAGNLLGQLGVHRTFIDAAAEDPHQVIRRYALMDDEVIQAKRTHVAAQREILQQVQEVASQKMSRSERINHILSHGRSSDQRMSTGLNTTTELAPVLLERNRRVLNSDTTG